MLVLALDTSSPAVSAALVRVEPQGREVLAEHVVVDARRHGELLALGVRAVLDGRPATELAAVVVGLGPGPFTGLRVGLVTAASMGDALGVPAYGVCSLDAVGQGERVVVTDARRKEVYWATYDESGGRTAGPAVDRPDTLDHSGVTRIAGMDLFGLPHTGIRYPTPAGLVRAADLDAEPGPLTPLYLRRPDAMEPGARKRVTAP